MTAAQRHDAPLYSIRLVTAILAEHSATDRLNLAAALFIKQASISEVSNKIASAVDESLSRQQKEYFLRQQMTAIQRELQSLSNSANNNNNSNNNHNMPGVPTNDSGQPVSELDDDEAHEASDLADIKAKIEAMTPGTEERKMGVREWRRLKRIPVGSVENGVVRTYVCSPNIIHPSHTDIYFTSQSQLEWLTSLPWPSSTPTTPSALSTSTRHRSFLANARAQLDTDHFGLEKIKKRLIEYLAVVRLNQINAAQDEAQEALAKATAAAAADSANPNPSGVPSSPGHSTNSKVSKSKRVKGPILLCVLSSIVAVPSARILSHTCNEMDTDL